MPREQGEAGDYAAAGISLLSQPTAFAGCEEGIEQPLDGVMA
jgi:hypothetical protein